MTDQRYWGKYRGRVVDNLDPLELGRLQVEVPQVMAVAASWALPCVPYAGPQVGFYFIPPIGANVWVEFEGGRADYPIWVGCFWSELEKPAEAVDPEVKLIQTQTSTFIMNDTPGEGGITISTRDPAVEVPAMILMDSAGVRLSAEPATVSMTPEEGITITFPPNEVALTEAGISANSGEAVTVEAGGDISILAAGIVDLTSTDVAINAAAIEGPSEGSRGPA